MIGAIELIMCDIWISVIVPAYNAEEHIDKCLYSLVRQELFEKIEVLIVDDGSTDQTGSIADSYSKKYENIRTFHIRNKGVSSARNLGIENSKGMYVAFLDADDWIESQFCSEMYYTAIKEKADIVASGILFDTENETIVSRPVTDKYRVLDKESALAGFLCGNIDVHVVDKIFKRELLTKHRFDSMIKIAEDRLFLFEFLLKANRSVLLPNNFYHYYQNSESVMNQQFTRKNLDSIIVSKKILAKTQLIEPKLTAYAECMYIADACRIYGEIIQNKKCDIYRKEYEELKQDINNFSVVKSMKYSSKKHVAALILAKISPHLYNKLRGNTRIKFGK